MAKKKFPVVPLVIGGGAVGGLVLLSQAGAAGESLPEFIGGALTGGLEFGLEPLGQLPQQIGENVFGGITEGVTDATRQITGGIAGTLSAFNESIGGAASQFGEAAGQIGGAAGTIAGAAQTAAEAPGKIISGVTDITSGVGATIGQVTLRGLPVAVPVAALGAPLGPVGIAGGAAVGGALGNIVFGAGQRAGEFTRETFPDLVQNVNTLTGGLLKSASDFSRLIFGG